MGQLQYSSRETSTGIRIGARVIAGGRRGVLWGIGFDPKGELCMVRLDSGIKIEVGVGDLSEP